MALRGEEMNDLNGGASSEVPLSYTGALREKPFMQREPAPFGAGSLLSFCLCEQDYGASPSSGSLSVSR